MPTSDADPQTSATASHPGNVTRVAARSDSADGGSAGTVFGVVAICYKWGDAKSPRNGHSFNLLPTSDDLLPALVVAEYHKDATTRLFSARSLRGCGHRHCFYGGAIFLWLGVQLGG